MSQRTEGELKEDSKPDIMEFYKKLGGSATEGKDMKEIDYWAAVDSFLSSVKHVRSEPVDVGDEAILRRFRSTNNYIKKYEEAMNDTKSDGGGDGDGGGDDDDGDDYDDEAVAVEAEEAEPLRETSGEESRIPVPTVSAEAERLLRSARTLNQQTAQLRSFLKDLLSEGEPGERVGLPSSPELEETSVKKMMSPSRKIAEKKEELEIEEEYPVAAYPEPIQE